MSDDEHVLDSLPAYALGCLDGTEARLVAEHLGGCHACRQELNTLQSVVDHLALSVPVAAPPPDLKHQLMDRVPAPRPAPQPPQRATSMPLLQRLLPAWAIVSLLLVAALSGTTLLLWQQVGRLESLTVRAGMRAVALRSTGRAPEASGFVIISENGESGTLVVDGLPQLDETQQQYQLWLIRDGQYISGAVFSVNEGGYRGTRIEAPESLHVYESVYISIEPAGGSIIPSGDQVLDGVLRRP